MLHLDVSWAYAAPVGEVFHAMTRLDHLEQKAAALGHHQHSVLELREREGVFRSVTTRQVQTRLPRIAALLYFTPLRVRSRNMITHSQLWQPPSWNGSRWAQIEVAVSGVPVQISGVGALEPADVAQTIYRIQLTVTATVGLIGALVERETLQTLRTTVQNEHEFRAAWLAGARFPLA